MNRVLFVSPTTDEQKSIEDVARHHEKGKDLELYTTSSFGQTDDFWNEAQIDLIVVSLPEDKFLQSAFLLKIRNQYPQNKSLILISPEITEGQLNLSSIFRKLRLLKSPIDGFSLYRAILDLLTPWQEGKQQNHPRYLTDQKILISRLNDEKVVTGQLKNLSVGGAFFELADLSLGLQTADEVRIEIPVPERTQIQFQAKIVWSREMKQGRHGYGCLFLLDDELQNKFKRF